MTITVKQACHVLDTLFKIQNGNEYFILILILSRCPLFTGRGVKGQLITRTRLKHLRPPTVLYVFTLLTGSQWRTTFICV